MPPKSDTILEILQRPATNDRLSMNGITGEPLFKISRFVPQGMQRSKILTKCNVLGPLVEALGNVVAEYRRPTVADRAG